MKIRIFLLLAFIFVSGCCREAKKEPAICVYFCQDLEFAGEKSSQIFIKIDLEKNEAIYSGLNGERIREVKYSIFVDKDYVLKNKIPRYINITKKLSKEDAEKIRKIYSALEKYDFSHYEAGTIQSTAWPWFVKIVLPEDKSFVFYFSHFVSSTDASEPPYNPDTNPNVYGEFIPQDILRDGEYWDSPITEFLILLKQIFAKELNPPTNISGGRYEPNPFKLINLADYNR